MMLRKHPLRSILINAFLAFHLVALTLWVLPVNASLTAFLHRSIGPYFSLIGLSQEWSLFAPDPISSNSYVDAQVVLGNGESRTWNFPHLETLGFRGRYSKARYRKFTGWLFREHYAYAWPDTARYIARQFQSSPDPPRTVTLVHRWVRIPPITAGHFIEPLWHSAVFFVYQVPPGDLP